MIEVRLDTEKTDSAKHRRNMTLEPIMDTSESEPFVISHHVEKFGVSRSGTGTDKTDTYTVNQKLNFNLESEMDMSESELMSQDRRAVNQKLQELMQDLGSEDDVTENEPLVRDTEKSSR